jgi:hypothetical protein
VDDVTAHPALPGGAQTLAGVFDRLHAFPDECLTPDPGTGEPLNVGHMIPRSVDDLCARGHLAHAHDHPSDHRQVDRCPDRREPGARPQDRRAIVGVMMFLFAVPIVEAPLLVGGSPGRPDRLSRAGILSLDETVVLVQGHSLNVRGRFFAGMRPLGCVGFSRQGEGEQSCY